MGSLYKCITLTTNHESNQSTKNVIPIQDFGVFSSPDTLQALLRQIVKLNVDQENTDSSDHR